MKPVTFSLQFRGVATAEAAGVLVVRATAPGCSLVTIVDEEGVHGHFEPATGGEAVLDARIQIRDAGTFAHEGTVAFGHRHLVRFRSVEGGRLQMSPDRHLQHGCVILEIVGGHGQFANARGRITSNFFLSDTGEVTDNQLGLFFVDSGLVSED
jgi:hypothetical protein